MLKLIALFLIIAGTLMIGYGLGPWSAGAGAMAWLLAGAVALGAAAWLDHGRERRERERELERNRAAAYAASCATSDFLEHWQTGQVLKVRGYAGRWPAVIALILIGALVTWLGLPWGTDETALLTLCGGMLLTSGLWPLVRMLSTLGQPLLELSAMGVRLPLYGRVAWRDIAGIHVAMGYARDGRPMQFQMQLKLAHGERAVAHWHWTDRLLGVLHLGPQAKGVICSGSCAMAENPGKVEALARRLWREATGRDDVWLPGMPAALAASVQRQSRLMARLQAHASDDASPATLDRMARDVEELEHETAESLRESRRLATRSRWIGGLIVVAGLVLMLVCMLFGG